MSPATKPPSEGTFTRTGKIVLVVLLLGIGAGAFKVLSLFRKPPAPSDTKPPLPVAEVVTVTLEPATMQISSEGLVEAATETRAASEVAGKIVWVSPKFEAGGTFAANEELLRLDDSDYKAALASAKAAEAEARTFLQVEQARAEQALRDWKKLEGDKPPDSALVTRQPQLDAAQAKLDAAAAATAKAQRDLERTILRPFYAGKIRKTYTDLGSYVAPGTPLADLYSTERFEVRLPLSLDDFNFLDISNPNQLPSVKLQFSAGGSKVEFSGEIVRMESEVDRQNRSVYVVARLKEPLDAALLAPGLFLHATITGKTIPGLARIPRICLFGDDSVWVLDKENKLHSRRVKILRGEKNSLLISEGLQSGERVLATALATLTEGMQVEALEPKSTAAPEDRPKTAEPATAQSPVP